MTSSGKKAPVLPILITVFVIVALGAVLYTGFLYFSTNIAGLNAQRDELNRYVTSDRTASAYQESLDFQQKSATMGAMAGGVKSALVALSSYPDVTYAVYQRIEELAGSDVTLSGLSYDRRTGILSFSATSENVTSFPVFVASLRNTELFADIQYRGYVKSSRQEIAGQSTDDDGITTTSYYTIVEYGYSVQCQLATPSPRLPDIPGREGSETAETSDGGHGTDPSPDTGEGGGL
jgi:hypothetical protein